VEASLSSSGTLSQLFKAGGGFVTCQRAWTETSRHVTEVIEEEEGLASLEPFWDKLLERSATRSPFLRWDWIWTWWRHFGEGRKLAVIVVRGHRGEVEAIAPFMLSKGDHGLRRHLRLLTWISGQGPVQGERMDALVPLGREAEFGPLLSDALTHLPGHACHGVWLPMIPAESPNLDWLMKAVKSVCAGAGVAEKLESRWLKLPNNWEEIEPGSQGRWRRRMRRKNILFLQKHEGRRCEEGGGGAMDELARLHAFHWPKGRSHFVTDVAWGFHRELGARWLKSGRALMPCLATPERGMVAALYGFAEGDEFSFYQHGWDPALARLSPGNLVLNWSMELCSRRQMRLFDMLPGDQPYKAEWCRESRPLVSLEGFHPWNPKALLARWARKMS